MSIASLVWNAMQLYSLAGHSHNACKLLKKWQTPEKSQNETISNQVITGKLLWSITTSLPILSSYLWTQTPCHPWLWTSGLPGCSVPWHRWWMWGACRWGRSSGSSGPPRCCCCRGRWSAEWGRAPPAAPHSAGSPTLRAARWSGLPWGAGWAGGARPSGRWSCRRCTCGRGSGTKQRETLSKHHLGYRAMPQASHCMLKWHQLHILRNTSSFLLLLLVPFGFVCVTLHGTAQEHIRV